MTRLFSQLEAKNLQRLPVIGAACTIVGCSSFLRLAILDGPCAIRPEKAWSIHVILFPEALWGNVEGQAVTVRSFENEAGLLLLGYIRRFRPGQPRLVPESHHRALGQSIDSALRSDRMASYLGSFR